MIETIPSPNDKAIGFRLSGRLHDDDYKTFVPIVDEAIGGGTNRILAQFHDFKGWDLEALWDDSLFAKDHATKLERIALVGESHWEEWMAKLCKPFTEAKIRYFDVHEIDDAWAWLGE